MFGVFAVTGDFPYVLMVGNGSELREFLTFAISFGAIIVLFLGYVIGQILPRR
jgi:multidrug efflux pump subunit AcrB